MMEKINNRIIATYAYDDYIVEIEGEEDGWLGAWLYRADMGVKTYMFGGEVDIDRLLVLVEQNIGEYIVGYEEEFNDCP